NYLSQFGYLQPINPTSGGIISQDTLSKAISEFQAFAGLNITGESNVNASWQLHPLCSNRTNPLSCRY
ncbi:hypothetical protein K0M31_004270, partial [Melipona bicolor]